jgi:4-oxalocrotonate tautomerase
MPLIEVKLVEGVLSDSQKQQLIKGLTEVMVSVEGEHLRPYTLVLIQELKTGDWAVGGQPMTTQAIKKIARGEAA